MDFFRNLGKGGDKNSPQNKNSSKSNSNPLSNVAKGFGANRKFQGTGQSLGGSNPGRVIEIVLSEPGPLGMRIEKRPTDDASAIVSEVVPGSQAQAAGLQRGDILCYGGTNGEAEISYKHFLQMAQSTERPLCLDIRRVDTKAAVPDSSRSAEAYSRKQAVIAAAEARERKNKAITKPLKHVTKSTLDAQNVAQGNSVSVDEPQLTPMSEEARRAVEAAKQSENQLAAQLGYNPYEASKSTSGQARNATVTMTHGSVSASNEAAPGGVAPPAQPVSAPEPAKNASKVPSVSVAFEQAFELLVTGNILQDAVLNSLSIMRKLIVNATTKGQNTADLAAAAKFRKVRLSNPKIKAAITDVHGGLELMLSVGFQLSDEGGESFLVYPPGDNGPAWLPRALQQMEQYASS
mmetsp:Transcript_21943/g.50642  ORF Transcript_21943/g.50642 Transcript_21943/m.50642 type:complete len:406 (+) Transcript_21943:1-1218(+)